MAKRKARELLCELGCSSLPIDPMKIIEEFPADYHIEIMSWSDFRKVFNVDDPYLLETEGADARTVIKDGIYTIVYKDSAHLSYPDRLNFTLAHEIGHIYMNHLTDFDLVRVNRGVLQKAQYEVLEKEADFFASELLMPMCLFKEYCPEITQPGIKLLCGVSFDASRVRYETLKNKEDYECKPYDKVLKRNFFSFFHDHCEETIFNRYCNEHIVVFFSDDTYDLDIIKCPDCNTINNKKNHYCYYCGSKLVEDRLNEQDSSRLWSSSKMMIRNFRNVNCYKIGGKQRKGLPIINIQSGFLEHERFTVCPICLNHDLKDTDEYCSKCGIKVTARRCRCGEKLELKDSFCPHCGKEQEFHIINEEFYKRNDYIEQETAKIAEKWDLIPYPYWDEFVENFRGSMWAPGASLYSLLLYSRAFILDDEDAIVIFSLFPDTERIIHRLKDKIITVLKSKGYTFSSIMGCSLIQNDRDSEEQKTYSVDGLKNTCTNGHECDSNACFCSHCGSMTGFFKSGYIVPWYKILGADNIFNGIY